MSESASVGYVLGQLLATDGDSGPDAEFEFLLVADSNNKGFSLDRQSGQLVVAEELDRESVETITLTALVKNPGPVRGKMVLSRVEWKGSTTPNCIPTADEF